MTGDGQPRPTPSAKPRRSFGCLSGPRPRSSRTTLERRRSEGGRMKRFSIRVNGDRRTVEADPEMPLLWVLRDRLGLTGTKYGCGVGVCGACTVLRDGRAVRSCQISV